MTRDTFAAECGKRLIDPALAIENEAVYNALRESVQTGQNEKVLEALDNEF